jgi:hypothetical protein
MSSIRFWKRSAVVPAILLLLSLVAVGQEIARDKLAKDGEVAPQLRGRVVFDAEPEQGVANIEVSGRAIHWRLQDPSRFRVRTDKDGYFTIPVPDRPIYIRVFDSALLRGALQVVEPGQNDIVLQLAPTATIRGTVFDAQNEVPLKLRVVSAETEFTVDQNFSNSELRRTDLTDRDGKFQIEGLIPGCKYQLRADILSDRGNYLYTRVGSVEITAAETKDVGQLEIPKTHLTFEELVASRYLDKPPEERLERGLKLANVGSVRLLVIAMEPDDDAAKQFYVCLQGGSFASKSVDHAELNQRLLEFIPMSVAPQESAHFLETRGITIPAKNDASFAVLNAKGAVAAEIAFHELQVDGKFDPKLLTTFLKTHSLTHPNANEAFDAALAEVKRDDKRLLIHTGGPRCGPCYLLTLFLDEYKSLLGKDYVFLKLDSRMPEFDELYQELTQGTHRGMPWMTILDAEGNTLITGDTEEGTIGFPTTGKSLEQFRLMLTNTRQRLTDNDISSLIAALQEAGEKTNKQNN